MATAGTQLRTECLRLQTLPKQPRLSPLIPLLLAAAAIVSAAAWDTRIGRFGMLPAATTAAAHVDGQGNGGAFPPVRTEALSHATATTSAASSAGKQDQDVGTAWSRWANSAGFRRQRSAQGGPTALWRGSRRLQQLVPYSLLYRDGSE